MGAGGSCAVGSVFWSSGGRLLSSPAEHISLPSFAPSLPCPTALHPCSLEAPRGPPTPAWALLPGPWPKVHWTSAASVTLFVGRGSPGLLARLRLLPTHFKKSRLSISASSCSFQWLLHFLYCFSAFKSSTSCRRAAELTSTHSDTAKSEEDGQELIWNECPKNHVNKVQKTYTVAFLMCKIKEK